MCETVEVGGDYCSGVTLMADLFVDLAELLQVVLQEDNPLPLSQTAAGLVAVTFRTLLREQTRS